MQDGTYSCKEMVKLLSDYIDGECSPEEKALIEAHLADCPNCMAFVNTFRKSISMARSLVHEDIPEDLQDRLHRVLADKTKLGSKPRQEPAPPFFESGTNMEEEERI